MFVEQRLIKAEDILYDWACDLITTKEAKDLCFKEGLVINFRQAYNGNIIEAYDKVNGNMVTLEI